MRLPLVLLLGCTALAACSNDPPPAAAVLPIATGDARIEWRGRAGCADCDGIDTVLMLERNGELRRYELVETFLADRDGARFNEAGDWRMQDATIDLSGDDGAHRRYTVMPQGLLRAHAADGDPGHGALLVPFQAATR